MKQNPVLSQINVELLNKRFDEDDDEDEDKNCNMLYVLEEELKELRSEFIKGNDDQMINKQDILKEIEKIRKEELPPSISIDEMLRQIGIIDETTLSLLKGNYSDELENLTKVWKFLKDVNITDIESLYSNINERNMILYDYLEIEDAENVIYAIEFMKYNKDELMPENYIMKLLGLNEKGVPYQNLYNILDNLNFENVGLYKDVDGFLKLIYSVFLKSRQKVFRGTYLHWNNNQYKELISYINNWYGKTDIDSQKILVEAHPLSLEYADDSLKSNSKFILSVIKDNYISALKYVDSSLRTKESFIRDVIIKIKRPLHLKCKKPRGRRDNSLESNNCEEIFTDTNNKKFKFKILFDTPRQTNTSTFLLLIKNNNNLVLKDINENEVEVHMEQEQEGFSVIVLQKIKKKE